MYYPLIFLAFCFYFFGMAYYAYKLEKLNGMVVIGTMAGIASFVAFFLSLFIE